MTAECNTLYIHYFQAALHAHIASIVASLQHLVLVNSGEREQQSVLYVSQVVLKPQVLTLALGHVSQVVLKPQVLTLALGRTTWSGRPITDKGWNMKAEISTAVNQNTSTIHHGLAHCINDHDGGCLPSRSTPIFVTSLPLQHWC